MALAKIECQLLSPPNGKKYKKRNAISFLMKRDLLEVLPKLARAAHVVTDDGTSRELFKTECVPNEAKPSAERTDRGSLALKLMSVLQLDSAAPMLETEQVHKMIDQLTEEVLTWERIAEKGLPRECIKFFEEEVPGVWGHCGGGVSPFLERESTHESLENAAIHGGPFYLCEEGCLHCAL